MLQLIVAMEAEVTIEFLTEITVGFLDISTYSRTQFYSNPIHRIFVFGCAGKENSTLIHTVCLSDLDKDAFLGTATVNQQ